VSEEEQESVHVAKRKWEEIKVDLRDTEESQSRLD
jgi:hypothetical protein